MLKPVPTAPLALARLCGLTVLLVSALLLSALPREAQANSRYSSIVIDADTGRVLHARHADAPRYPASMTKLMTLYFAFDQLRTGAWTLNTMLTTTPRAAGMQPTKLGLKRGQRIRVEDAIVAVAVKSANDAAVVIAENIAENEREFAQMMTQRARQLGMRKTTFSNASGLPDRTQKSTARDMAILSKALLEHFPQYYHYFKRRTFRFGGKSYRTSNRLLGSYRGLDGLKTGYIRASGFNLAASAERGGRRLIAVVHGGRSSRSRNQHMVELLDQGFVQLGAAVASADGVVRVAAPRPGTEQLAPRRNPLRYNYPATVVATVDPSNATGVNALLPVDTAGAELIALEALATVEATLADLSQSATENTGGGAVLPSLPAEMANLIGPPRLKPRGTATASALAVPYDVSDDPDIRALLNSLVPLDNAVPARTPPEDYEWTGQGG